MKTVDLVVHNPSGLHARPAALFAETAARFGARITVQNLDRGSPPVEAKSVLFVLTTGVQQGHRIRLTADGADEDAAIETIVSLVEAGLGEAVPDEASLDEDPMPSPGKGTPA